MKASEFVAKVKKRKDFWTRRGIGEVHGRIHCDLCKGYYQYKRGDGPLEYGICPECRNLYDFYKKLLDQ